MPPSLWHFEAIHWQRVGADVTFSRHFEANHCGETYGHGCAFRWKHETVHVATIAFPRLFDTWSARQPMSSSKLLFRVDEACGLI